MDKDPKNQAFLDQNDQEKPQGTMKRNQVTFKSP